MNWILLKSETQWNDLLVRSANKPQLVFKYSSRCGLSDRIREKLEFYPEATDIDFYFLDIFQHRRLSDMIAEQLSVRHESPQVLLVKNGECIYDDSHTSIRMEEILENAGSSHAQPKARGLQ